MAAHSQQTGDLPRLLLTRRALCATAGATIMAPGALADETLRVSVSEFPDPFITPALIDALEIGFGKLPGVTATFVTLPFARSVATVAQGLSDVHFPIIRSAPQEGRPWVNTTATFYPVPFVLYTNANHPLDINRLGAAQVETDPAHTGLFDFPVSASAGIESSLRKVAAGRLEGYVFAGNICDPLLARMELTNVASTLYRWFDAAGALPVGGVGSRVDRLVSAAMAAAAADPGFKRAIAIVLQGYHGAIPP